MPDRYYVAADGAGVDTVWRHDPQHPHAPQPVVRDGEPHYPLLRRVYAPTDADVERTAPAVHQAYLETCERLGWPVKPANAVPYDQLSEDSKELDRATVRAVLAALAGQTGDE